MNPKIAKLEKEIEKTSAKVNELQGKLRDLEKQKTELENTEIVALVRNLQMTPEQLADFLQGKPVALAQPIQPGEENADHEI